MGHTRAFALIALIALCGCLNMEPKPLNETGFLPPIQNHSEIQQPSQQQFDLSSPLKCTMDAPQGGQIVMRISGTKMRSDYFDPNTNATYTTLMVGEDYYTTPEQIPQFENCTWLLFNRSAFKDPQANTSFAANATPFGQMPGLPKCAPDSFGPEIFAVNGTICDITNVNISGV